ncbi:PEGA domain-containing protein, partial [Deltaproteobacteria bacterium TL4]
MKLIRVSVLIPLLWFGLLGFALAQEKPQAAVAPLAVIGEISVAQKQIIFNSMLDELSKYYNLISQEQFNQAQEKAYEELEAEQCTETQCILKIQELLQVENLFVLQLVREGEDTQLSLTLVDLEKKTLRSDFCEGCNTKQLNQRIAGLVTTLLGQTALLQPRVLSSALAGTSRVFVSSNPTDADIYLDGTLLEQKSDVLLEAVPVGKHTLLLRKGALSQSQQVEVNANQLTSVNLTLEISKTRFLISSQPFKAEAVLDGKSVGETPVEIETTLGSHQVELKLTGYVPVSEKVILKFGEPNQFNVKLVDGRQFKGFLTVTSMPSDTTPHLEGGTYVTAKLNPHTLPLSKLELPIGSYQMVLTKEGYEALTQKITLEDQKLTSLDFSLKALPAKLALKISRKEG